MEDFLLISGIFVLGLFFVYSGIMIRLGKWRRQLLFRGFPVLASPGSFLISIPLGLFLITTGLMMVFPELKDILTFPLMFFVFSAIILSFWMPDWLLPKWFRWLVRNYEHVLGDMFEEAREMDLKEWEQQTRTQEGLEQWADSVARKNGWQRQEKG